MHMKMSMTVIIVNLFIVILYLLKICQSSNFLLHLLTNQVQRIQRHCGVRGFIIYHKTKSLMLISGACLGISPALPRTGSIGGITVIIQEAVVWVPVHSVLSCLLYHWNSHGVGLLLPTNKHSDHSR